MSELPQGWVSARLGELGAWRGGGTPSTSKDAFWHEGSIPWVSPKDMKRDVIDDSEDKITHAAIKESATQLIPPNSVLVVTRSGILQHSLPVAINTREVAINQDLKALTPTESVSANYVCRFLRARALDILRDCAKAGTTVDSIDFNKLKAFNIPMAPLSEQRRIVTKLDSLTGCTARAREQLGRIPKLVEMYRESLITAGLSGELTGNPKRKGWIVCQAKELFTWSSGKFLPKSKQAKGKIPVYGGNGVTGAHDRALVEQPTIVVGRVGAQCGNVHLTNGPAWVTDNAIFALEISQSLDPRFGLTVLRHSKLNAQSGGTGQPYVNQDILNEVEFSLPPMKEQQEIIRRIETAFVWLDRVVTEHANASRLLPRLDQAILAKAFRGELVPQEPDEKPIEFSVPLAAEAQDRRGRPTKQRTGT
jgi:type I restriction enzyme S subunit